MINVRLRANGEVAPDQLEWTALMLCRADATSDGDHTFQEQRVPGIDGGRLTCRRLGSEVADVGKTHARPSECPGRQ